MPLTANQVADYFAQCRATDAAERDQSPYQDKDYTSFMQKTEDFVLEGKGSVPHIGGYNYNVYSWAIRELPDLLPATSPWGQYEGRLCQVLFHPKNRDHLFWGLDYWLSNLVLAAGEFDIMASAAPALRQAGLKDADILDLGFDGDSDLPFSISLNQNETFDLQKATQLSSFGHYILSLLPQQAPVVVKAATGQTA
ncbi:MAG: hypothetical protein MUC97_02120, partial [Bernardetiaceae bacterium]|nr:hypothetical protein [Bernardetiaceae bacterium]